MIDSLLSRGRGKGGICGGAGYLSLTLFEGDPRLP